MAKWLGFVTPTTDRGFALRGEGRGCVAASVRGNVHRTLPEVRPIPPEPTTFPLDRVEPEIMRMVGQVLGRPVHVTADAALLADLGFDSLRVLELVGEIEDRYSISVPLNSLTHVKSVGDIASEVRRLIGTQDTH